MSKDKNDGSDEKLSSFPSEALDASIDIVSQIVKRKGDTCVSFKEIAIILGRPEGTLVLPVSTCAQYGLFENVFGKGYRATDLFHKIERPVYESDKIQATMDALSSAPLYKKLIDQFNGKVLPDEQGMTNHLIKDFGIKPYLIHKVVKAFFKNFRDYDLIDGNNRLRFLPPIKSDNLVSKNNGTPVEEIKEVAPVQIVTNKMFELPIDLTGQKMAYLKYPKGDMTLSDIAMLEVMLNATLSALKARLKLPEGEKN